MTKRRGRGEGSIYQRADGRWVGSVDFGWVDGRRKRKVVSGKTRAEVVRKVSLLTAQKAQGLPPTDDRLTLETFLDRWLLTTAKPRVRYSTYRGYEQIVRVHLKPGLGKIRLSKLTPGQVETFHNDLLAKGLSARTVQYIHAVLRTALKTAVRDGLIGRNVAALVSAPKVHRDPVEPLTVEEAKRLVDEARGDPLEAVYVTTLALGLRQGETMGLRWDAVDLEAGRLWVRQALQYQAGRGLVAVEPKSRTSRRPLPLPPFVVAVLKEHRKRQAADRLVAGPKWQDSGYVFTMEDGRPMPPDYAYRQFKKFLARAGLRPIRFHDLRHSCASLLFAQGCSLRLVMEILGHSQIAITANLYTHLLPEADREAAGIMQALLGGTE